jgi:hypothetical protein
MNDLIIPPSPSRSVLSSRLETLKDFYTNSLLMILGSGLGWSLTLDLMPYGVRRQNRVFCLFVASTVPGELEFSETMMFSFLLSFMYLIVVQDYFRNNLTSLDTARPIHSDNIPCARYLYTASSHMEFCPLYFDRRHTLHILVKAVY